MQELMVQLLNLTKRFEDEPDEDQVAVKDVSFDIRKGEFLTLLGPSGCGKTTILRMIAGFIEPTAGAILLENQDVSHLQPYKRDINTVFQNYALFPHMNIYNNIAFGLKIKKFSKAEIKDKVFEALKLVQLEGYENKLPSQLSGGQKQRVAIARAIVNSPKVLLLDEPLGALDLKLRKQMQYELKHLQQKLGITFIYVTHDQEEALTMSDRIIVMNGGKVEQIGTPNEIYERPKTKFAATFIGETNVFESRIVEQKGENVFLEIEDGQQITLKVDRLPEGKAQMGKNILITVRPERMKLSYINYHDNNVLFGKIKERIYVGSIQKTIVSLQNGREIVVNEPAGYTLNITDENQDVIVTWESENVVVINE